MSIAELQAFTAVSKYARHLEDKGRRETWPDTVHRYGDMMVKKYPGEEQRIREICSDYILPMRVLPSMRGLQFGGEPIFKHAARLYNCTSSFVDRLSFFGQAFYLLLCGAGVGYSVQSRHVEHLSDYSKARRAGKVLPKKTFVVPDSIEGWAECAYVQQTSFHERPVPGYEQYLDCDITFDYSRIRPKGTLLSFGIGKAPGADPLARAMARNDAMLRRAIESGERKMTSVVASDYHLNCSDSVISGGIRRSANIALFDLEDDAMMNYKTGNWFYDNPQRGRANISAVLLRGQVEWHKFRRLFEATKEFGEPGFFWTNDANIVPNPCVEVGNYPLLWVDKYSVELKELTKRYDGPLYQEGSEVGLSGFQMCNLTTQNGKVVKTKGDLLDLSKVASELGTYQAGFNKFPFLGAVTEAIVRGEAIIGVSIAGVMHNPEVMLDPATLTEAAEAVIDANEKTAKRIGINSAARTSCLKPDGNSASVLGCFSGCHAGKMRRGFRISQVNKGEGPYSHFRQYNPEACEESAWSANGTDDCIRFPVEYEGLLENDMTAIEFLEHVRTLQNYWVKPGTVKERCVRPNIYHNVSNTVRVRPHEWEGVAKKIFDHQDDYGGVSFIADSGDRDYVQAPFTPVFDEQEMEVMYGVGVSHAVKLAEQVVSRPSPYLWRHCDIATGTLEARADDDNSFVSGLRDMAIRFFGGDNRKAVLATKDAYNLSLYRKLKASYKTVDWSLMREAECNVNLQGEVACAGGACEVDFTKV